MSPAAGLADVVLAGGGTAGHVLPALAIGEALVAAGHDRGRIHVVGAERGMERTLVPAAGFPLHLLDVHGIPRTVSVGTAKASGRMATAVGGAMRLLRRLQPRAVVSVGGYASLPCVVGAVGLRIPVVTVSYDAVPGRASRVAARFATATAVAFPDSPLPRAVLTGAPLRPEIATLDRATARAGARAALGLPADRFTVLVVGGSLGSGALNEATRRFVASHPDRSDLAVYHVVGERNAGAGWVDRLDGDGIVHRVVGYEGRMHLAYAAADLALARAGATTVAELAAVGLPSILVPWPLATEDHQTANARWLARAGGALLVPEPQLTPERLVAEVDRLQGDPAALAAMAGAARAAGHRDAAERIAALVDRSARR